MISEKIKYFREINAYKYFNRNKIDFVPKLISEKDGVLNIEYLDGETLYDKLLNNKPFNYKKVVEQIALID